MHDEESLQVLPILAIQTAICLPNPVPSWCVLSTCCEEYDGIVGLNCRGIRNIKI